MTDSDMILVYINNNRQALGSTLQWVWNNENKKKKPKTWLKMFVRFVKRDIPAIMRQYKDPVSATCLLDEIKDLGQPDNEDKDDDTYWSGVYAHFLQNVKEHQQAADEDNIPLSFDYYFTGRK